MTNARFVRGIGGGVKRLQSARTGAMPMRCALLVASFFLASVAIVLLGLVVRFFSSDADILSPILDAFRGGKGRSVVNKFADQLRIYIVIGWFLLINMLIFISTVRQRDLYKVVISNIKNYFYLLSPFNILIVVMISAYMALDVFQIVRVPEIIYDEDGIAETATVVFLLLSTGLLISSSSKLIRRKQEPAAVILILASMLAVFLAVEEVSWGQRIFGWETPALFVERNYQDETNLHNLLAEGGKYLIYIQFGFGFAISTLIVLAFEFSGADWVRHFRKLAPSEKMLLFALILPVASMTTRYHELQEELLSVGLLFYAMTLWTTLRGSSIGTAIRDGLGGRLPSGGPASILNDRNIGTIVFVIFVISGLLLFWLYSAP